MASIARRLSPKALAKHLRELGFENKLIRKFVGAPYNVDYATALLKSYSPPSRKPRKGRYNNLCLHKGARNQLWVVYDPLKHKPIFDNDALMLTTTSLRIRSSRIIVGQQIKYTANGPVLEPLDEEESDFEPKPATTVTTKKGRKATKMSKSKSSSDSELTEMESDT
ncbi:hypothetical protein KCU95_g14125, partial [Aureobasidium melanogenum]